MALWNSATGDGVGATDHGELTGLADDDHSQYHNDTRGDARYSLLGHNHDASYAAAAHAHEGTEIDATGVTDGYILTADGAGNAAWEVGVVSVNPSVAGLPFAQFGAPSQLQRYSNEGWPWNGGSTNESQWNVALPMTDGRFIVVSHPSAGPVIQVFNKDGTELHNHVCEAPLNLSGQTKGQMLAGFDVDGRLIVSVLIKSFAGNWHQVTGAYLIDHDTPSFTLTETHASAFLANGIDLENDFEAGAGIVVDGCPVMVVRDVTAPSTADFVYAVTHKGFNGATTLTDVVDSGQEVLLLWTGTGPKDSEGGVDYEHVTAVAVDYTHVAVLAVLRTTEGGTIKHKTVGKVVGVSVSGGSVTLSDDQTFIVDDGTNGGDWPFGALVHAGHLIVAQASWNATDPAVTGEWSYVKAAPLTGSTVGAFGDPSYIGEEGYWSHALVPVGDAKVQHITSRESDQATIYAMHQIQGDGVVALESVTVDASRTLPTTVVVPSVIHGVGLVMMSNQNGLSSTLEIYKAR
jgi:hypothetical protein